MLVKFSSKNATVYDRDRAAMEKKLEARLSRYFDDEPEITVKITEEKLGFKVKITLPYYGYYMRAEASSKDGLFAAFDSSVDIMERMMTNHKDRIISRKTRGEAQADVPVQPEEDPFDVVRVKRYEVKPMTVQDAILNMETLGHDFYVFLSAEENAICTVYKRKNGGYGLVVPKL